MTGSSRTISIDAIREAAAGSYGGAVRTPRIRVEPPAGGHGGHDAQGAQDDFQLYLKLELLQPIGSFKIRGAFNVIRRLTHDQIAGGVWTVSAGNAALGVAYVARQV